MAEVVLDGQVHPWSAKRLELYQVGRTLQMLGSALAESPNFPDDPWRMTLSDLNRHIVEELGRMNEMGQA